MARLVVILAIAFVSSAGITAACDPSCEPDASGLVVCGSDGVTYGSQCLLQRQQCRHQELHARHDGACTPSDNPTTAPPALPQLVHDCATPCVAPNDVLAPICATNNVTYANACHLRNARCQTPHTGIDIEVMHQGPCLHRLPDVPTFCSARCSVSQERWQPRCASDGLTYSTVCQFRQAFCTNVSAALTVQHDGPCTSPTSGSSGSSSGSSSSNL